MRTARSPARGRLACGRTKSSHQVDFPQSFRLSRYAVKNHAGGTAFSDVASVRLPVFCQTGHTLAGSHQLLQGGVMEISAIRGLPRVLAASACALIATAAGAADYP